MSITINPKFAIGETVYKVCKWCYACVSGPRYGCGVKCKKQYTDTVIETKVDGYKNVYRFPRQ